MKVLITGASGLLGKNIFTNLTGKYDLFGTYSTNNIDGLIKLNLENENNINNTLNSICPNVIIHTAALTNVEFCKHNPLKAKLINSDAVKIIAEWCKENNAKLIYISTDYVFDGDNSPYHEYSPRYPIQIYGYTKMLGEIFIENINCNYAIIRVGILHGYNDSNDKQTVTTSIINHLKRKATLELDDKRLKYPTLIDDVSTAIEKIIDEKLCGVFHVATNIPVTRYEWGIKIANYLTVDPSYLIPNKILDEQSNIKKPQNIKLLETRGEFSITSLDDSISYILKKMRKLI